ncbi:MAG: type 1 glutamine amidotransferase domain-containing protein [Tissierellia bacterium]|nr:type 1 glutamine amidotransferase domain-containing protein [Tissierellia bacterium]
MKKVIILIEDLFNEEELIYPYHRLREEFETVLVGTEKDKIYKSKNGLSFKSDAASAEINSDEYLGIFIPGGYSPDYMRRSQATVNLVREFDKRNKPIAAICHGPWLLASACDLNGRDITGFYSIKDDLINAGANYLDSECVISGNIISSRTPDDLPAIMKAFIGKLSK